MNNEPGKTDKPNICYVMWKTFVPCNETAILSHDNNVNIINSFNELYSNTFSKISVFNENYTSSLSDDDLRKLINVKLSQLSSQIKSELVFMKDARKYYRICIRYIRILIGTIAVIAGGLAALMYFYSEARDALYMSGGGAFLGAFINACTGNEYGTNRKVLKQKILQLEKMLKYINADESEVYTNSCCKNCIGILRNIHIDFMKNSNNVNLFPTPIKNKYIEISSFQTEYLELNNMCPNDFPYNINVDAPANEVTAVTGNAADVGRSGDIEEGELPRKDSEYILSNVNDAIASFSTTWTRSNALKDVNTNICMNSYSVLCKWFLITYIADKLCLSSTAVPEDDYKPPPSFIQLYYFPADDFYYNN